VGEFATGSSSNVGEVNVLERMALGAESSGSIVAMTPLRVVGLAASGGLGMFCCDTGPTELVRFGAGRSVMSGLSVEFATGGMEGAGGLGRASEGFTDTGLGGTGIATRDAQLVHVTNRAPAGASVSETRLSAPQAEQVASIIHMNHTPALPGSLSGNAGRSGKMAACCRGVRSADGCCAAPKVPHVPWRRFGRALSSVLNRRQRHCRRGGAARSALRSYLRRAASCCALSPGLPAWFRGR
jgi:hypothetical protein